MEMKIALIGMTGVGKTTVGKILAENLGCDFIDIDEMIIETTKKTPAEIFAEDGETVFRDIESNILEHTLTQDTADSIISCGGGIVLREKNRELLRQNAVVLWIMRPLDDIMQKSPEILSRPPINNNLENYVKNFKARESLYAQTCHFKIDLADFCSTENTADEAAAEIARVIAKDYQNMF